MSDGKLRTIVTLPASLLAVIDLAFAGMAEDEDYQSEATAIAAEFSSADWDAFQAGEPR